MNEYEGMNRIVYGEDRALFLPVCSRCGRFVKADATIRFQVQVIPGSWNDGIEPVEPNATCRKCGRVAMVWEGWE